MVIVPNVFMFILFLITPKPPAELLDKVPVPFKTMEVVPATMPVVIGIVTSPPAKILFPLIVVVNVVPPKVVVPEQFKLDESVIVDVPSNKTLFQVIPEVFKVVVAFTFNVEPVVTTVPAEYVNTPVL